MKKVIQGLFVIGAVIAVASPAAAEEGWTVSTTPGTQERGIPMGGGEMRLSLDEAVTLALQHNINLEINRLSLAATGEGILQASGIFDPLTQVSFTESYSESPATNQLVGAAVNTVKNRSFNSSLSKFLSTGTDATLLWNNSRTKTNSQFYFLNPNYDSRLTLQLSQSLLQGFGTDVNRSGIEVARRNRSISRMDFELVVIQTIQNVENAYWNLVYAQDNLAVRRQSLELAQNLLDQTRTRVRIGTSAPIDIIQSEATVAAREQDIILAENAVEAAADNLKAAMGFENPEDWTTTILPADSLEFEPVQVDLDVSITQALEDRLVLKQQRLNEEISRFNLLVAKNSTLPTLNLVGSYGFTGTAGAISDADLEPPAGGGTNPLEALNGSWGTALQQILDRDYSRWSVGFNLSYPLGNRSARAQLAQRRYQLQQAQQVLAAQKQSVIAEVRGAVRSVQASMKAVSAAVKARELAERNLDAEQKKFANGMSTNYQVLQIQEDLASAQASELQSRVAYRQSLVAYEVAVGNLLDNMGVAIADPGEPEEHRSVLAKADWLRYGHWTDLEPVASDGEPAAAEKPESTEE